MPNRISKKVFFNKRVRSLIRKAIELSNMCDVQVSLNIYDPEISKLVEFNSHDKIVQPEVRIYEYYDKEDYKSLENKFITHQIKKEIQERHFDKF